MQNLYVALSRRNMPEQNLCSSLLDTNSLIDQIQS